MIRCLRKNVFSMLYSARILCTAVGISIGISIIGSAGSAETISSVNNYNNSLSTDISNGYLRVDGLPMLPIVGILQPNSTSQLSYCRSLGFNMLIADPDVQAQPPLAYLDNLKQRGMKGITGYASDVTTHSALAAWLMYDEPDLAGIPSLQIQQSHNQLRTSDSLHPVFMRLVDGFYQDANYSYIPAALNGDRSKYLGYVQSADILGFSMYPVSQWNMPSWLYVPGASVAQLKAYGSQIKPAWAFIETNNANFPSAVPGARSPTAQEVAFQVWDSIIRGATGIGYHTLNYLTNNPIDLVESVKAELRKTNGEIETLQSVILSSPVYPSITAGEIQNKPFHYTSRRTGSRCYVFVSNADMNLAQETITFSFPRSIGRITEIRSNRQVSHAGSSFTDVFPPLAVHIYEIIFLPPSDMGSDYYVSPSGNNLGGTSWQNAWTELDQINWDIIKPGDTIYLDGGTTTISYNTELVVGQGGANDLSRVVIRRSEEPSHSGIVQINKKIKILMPYVTLDGGIADKFLIHPSDYMSGFFLGYWDDPATASEVYNASFVGAYSNSYGLSLSVYGNDCLIKNCVFDRSGGEDMLGIMSAGNVTIDGCTFRNLLGSDDPLVHRDVLCIYPGIAQGKRFILRNSLFENNRTDNFAVFPPEGTILGGIEIWGNTFRHCNTAIHLDSRVIGADYVNVYNNVFDNINVTIHNDSSVPIDGTYNSIIFTDEPTPTPAPEPTKTITPTPANTLIPTVTPTPTRTPRPNNSPPLAEAGIDIVADEETTVALCGSASSDPESDPLTYEWIQESGTPGIIQNEKTCTATLVLPAVEYNETLVFRLYADDNSLVSSDLLYVNVRDVEKPPTPGLVVAFSFEDSKSKYVLDSSGLENDGIVEGSTFTFNGYRGKAMSFDGIDDCITIPNYPRLDLTSGMTLEAWVYVSAEMEGWRPIICKESDQGILYSLFANSPSLSPATVLRVNGEQSLRAGAQVPKDKWTFLASTFNGQVHKLYVNGVLVGEQQVNGSLDTSYGPVRIGANTIWSEYFTGMIDEIRIYDMALDAAQISEDMNNPVPRLTEAKNWTLYE